MDVIFPLLKPLAFSLLFIITALLVLINLSAKIRELSDKVLSLVKKPAIRIVIALILFFILISGYFTSQGQLIKSKLTNTFNKLFYTSLEDRKIIEYGDRDKNGYGYIKYILEGIPENDYFPTTRYINSTRAVNLIYLGYRNKIDDRILVGIDIPEKDLRETFISVASVASPSINSSWLFKTQSDYDEMTSIKLFHETPAKNTSKLNINLLHSTKNPKILSSFTIPVDKNSLSTIYRLPNPVKKFSFGRGATDFVLEIKSNENLIVQKIEIYGVKISLSNYKIINKDKSSFTAIKNDFLSKIYSMNLTDWQTYIKRISNVTSAN